jgi:hypothetical protein
MSHNAEDAPRRGWYVAAWPPLAWLAMVIKLAALALGILALVQAQSWGVFWLPGGLPGWSPDGLRLAQLLILGLLSLGLVAAVFYRLAQREIVALAFASLNSLGHWGMVVALTSKPGPGGLILAFATLMLLGDLVKLVFLRVHGFTVRDYPRTLLYGLTLVYVTGYAVVLALEVVRWS